MVGQNVFCALLFYLLIPLISGQSSDNPCDRRYITSSAIEEKEGTLQTGSNDIELVDDKGVQTVGIQFRLQLPAGADFSGAALIFTADETSPANLVELKIQGEAVAQSAPFNSTYLVSTRMRTNATVEWDIEEAWENKDDEMKSPDVSDIIREIISIPGWKPNNVITFIITENGPNATVNRRTSTRRDIFLVFTWCGCLSGPCCDNSTYKVLPSTTVCREGNDLCAAPAYCDGSSVLCAPSTVAANGTQCRDGGVCTLGNCKCGDDGSVINKYEQLNIRSAEEFTINGSVSLTSTDLELGWDGDAKQMVGIQHRLRATKGSKIFGAKLTFIVDEANWRAPIKLVIQAEFSGNSAEFVRATFAVSSRKRTVEAVSWNITEQWTPEGSRVQSPDITNLVQAVVNHPDWAYGNIITFIISVAPDSPGPMNRRTAKKDVLLTLDWCGSVPKPPLPYCQIPYTWFPCDNSPGSLMTKCIAQGPDPREEMPINLTVAFFGDQELDPPPYNTGKRVELLRLLKDKEKVSAIFHAGDFDYKNNAQAWEDMLSAVLGPDFPYFSAIGNHDEPAWATPNGYSEKIFARYKKFGAKCHGDVGRDTLCTFKGLSFVTSGVGTSTVYSSRFLTESLRSYGGIWRVCLWHKNQHVLQLGEKGNEVGFEPYNACNEQGAIIINGHEHSYARSKPITFYTEPRPRFVDIPAKTPLEVKPGQTFVAVAGTAGISIRTCYRNKQNDPWWAAALCAPRFTDSGALVCKFNLNGDRRRAKCQFKTRTGATLDDFDVISSNPEFDCNPTPPPLPPITPTPVVTPTPLPPPVTPTPGTPTPGTTPTPGKPVTTAGASQTDNATAPVNVATIAVPVIIAVLVLAVIIGIALFCKFRKEEERV